MIFFLFLALPYLILLLLFFTWSNFLTVGEMTEGWSQVAAIFAYLIFINCLFILAQELF